MNKSAKVVLGRVLINTQIAARAEIGIRVHDGGAKTPRKMAVPKHHAKLVQSSSHSLSLIYT